MLLLSAEAICCHGNPGTDRSDLPGATQPIGNRINTVPQLVVGVHSALASHACTPGMELSRRDHESGTQSSTPSSSHSPRLTSSCRKAGRHSSPQQAPPTPGSGKQDGTSYGLRGAQHPGRKGTSLFHESLSYPFAGPYFFFNMRQLEVKGLKGDHRGKWIVVMLHTIANVHKLLS